MHGMERDDTVMASAGIKWETNLEIWKPSFSRAGRAIPKQYMFKMIVGKEFDKRK